MSLLFFFQKFINGGGHTVELFNTGGNDYNVTTTWTIYWSLSHYVTKISDWWDPFNWSQRVHIYLYYNGEKNVKLVIDLRMVL